MLAACVCCCTCPDSGAVLIDKDCPTQPSKSHWSWATQHGAAITAQHVVTAILNRTCHPSWNAHSPTGIYEENGQSSA
jgi:hypothetical protein